MPRHGKHGYNRKQQRGYAADDGNFDFDRRSDAKAGRYRRSRVTQAGWDDYADEWKSSATMRRRGW